jgi:hypothetical protein
MWNRIAFDQHRGAESLQCVDLAPMGRRSPAVERSSSGQEKRAAADRSYTRHSADRPGHNVRCRSAREFLSHPGLASDSHESVGAPKPLIGDLPVSQIGDELNAGWGCKWTRLRRRYLNAIELTRHRIIGASKHLERAGDIEQLAMRKSEQQNIVGYWHEANLPADPLWPKGQKSVNSGHREDDVKSRLRGAVPITKAKWPL